MFYTPWISLPFMLLLLLMFFKREPFNSASVKGFVWLRHWRMEFIKHCEEKQMIRNQKSQVLIKTDLQDSLNLFLIFYCLHKCVMGSTVGWWFNKWTDLLVEESWDNYVVFWGTCMTLITQSYYISFTYSPPTCTNGT